MRNVFTEDLNLIMRAIAQDTKAQEMLLEKEDMEGVPGEGTARWPRSKLQNKEYIVKLAETYP